MTVTWLERLRAHFRFRRVHQQIVQGHRRRHVLLERLDDRRMLAADLQISAFAGDGDELVVTYHVADQAAAAFNIGVYRSADGVTLGTLLETRRVTESGLLAPGSSHQVAISPSFTDASDDYFLMVVLDAAAEVAETNESNNALVLSGGAFTSSGVVHVHGGAGSDSLSISGSSTLSVNLNGSTYHWTASAVSSLRVRLHAGNDSQTTSSLTKPIAAWGGAGNDTLSGGAGNDWLYGDHGQIWGNSTSSGGDDTLYGDDGADWLFGEGGTDAVYGGGGNDTGYGGYGNDHVYSGATASSEYIFGDQGDDHLYLESPQAVAYDYSGTNVVHAYQAPVVNWSLFGTLLDVDGTAGNDTLTFSTEYFLGLPWLTLAGQRLVLATLVSTIVAAGGGGNDTIDLSGLTSGLLSNLTSVTVDGGGGHDTIVGSYAADNLSGGAGTDTLLGGAGNDTLYGGEDADYLNGGAGADWLDGGAGNDGLYADAGGYGYGGYGYGENLHGGYGDDALFGGSGGDGLYGDDGNDYLYGYGGNDNLYGGNGNDSLQGGDGLDWLDGGDGEDQLYAESGSYGGYGYGGYGYGYGGAEYLAGGAGNDGLFGGSGNDTLYGNDGDDTISGGAGIDTIYGGYGYDFIHGGDGIDILDGGVGHDWFPDAAADTVADRPRIVGFTITNLDYGTWRLTGAIEDDEDATGLTITFGGDLVGTCAILTDEGFSKNILNTSVTSGWGSASFTDAEGLSATAVWDDFFS